MALTGMQIYKSLPKTNCKDCGLPTCMAFAMQVAAQQRALEDCPHVSEEASSSLSESSAPPMKLISIGSPERKFEFGQETVLFRHEKRFESPPGIACGEEVSPSTQGAAARVVALVRVVQRLLHETGEGNRTVPADRGGDALAENGAGLRVVITQTALYTTARRSSQTCPGGDASSSTAGRWTSVTRGRELSYRLFASAEMTISTMSS